MQYSCQTRDVPAPPRVHPYAATVKDPSPVKPASLRTLALLPLLLLAAPLCAQQPAAAVPPPPVTADIPTQTTGAIHGTLLSPDGEPVNPAHLTLTPASGPALHAE